MKNTAADPVIEKQALIDQKRKLIIDRYPILWSEMIRDWKAENQEDAGWLMYSANYLFRTGGIRWALDPLTLKRRIAAAPQVDIREGLSELSVVLLSHEHNDHLDLELIRELKDLPIKWIVPQFMLEKVTKEGQLPASRIIVPELLQPIEVAGLKILPFEGQHFISYADGTRKGVPELGYLVEQSGKKLLFPGDTRIYDVSRFPKLGPVDVLFAHLWLGHGSALRDPKGLLEPFCKFCSDLLPKKVLITHLEEFGRKADDFFDESHVQKVKEVFSLQYSDIDCSSLHIGEKVLL